MTKPKFKITNITNGDRMYEQILIKAGEIIITTTPSAYNYPDIFKIEHIDESKIQIEEKETRKPEESPKSERKIRRKK